MQFQRESSHKIKSLNNIKIQVLCLLYSLASFIQKGSFSESKHLHCIPSFQASNNDTTYPGFVNRFRTVNCMHNLYTFVQLRRCVVGYICELQLERGGYRLCLELTFVDRIGENVIYLLQFRLWCMMCFSQQCFCVGDVACSGIDYGRGMYFMFCVCK